MQHVHKKCKRSPHYTVSYRLRSEMRTTDHGIASYGLEGRPPPVSPHTLLPMTSEEYERGTLSIFRPGKLQARIVDGKILVSAPLQAGPYGVFLRICMPMMDLSDAFLCYLITGGICYIKVKSENNLILIDAIEPCNTTRMRNFEFWTEGEDLRIECPSESAEFWCKIPFEIIKRLLAG